MKRAIKIFFAYVLGGIAGFAGGMLINYLGFLCYGV